jgi:hypothetical protein
MLDVFSCIYCPYTLLLRTVFRSFAWLLIIWFVLPMSYILSLLYVLEIYPLLNEKLAKISPHFVGCIFTLIIVSFAVQKFLIWCNLIGQFLILFPGQLESCLESYCLCLSSLYFRYVFPPHQHFLKYILYSPLQNLSPTYHIIFDNLPIFHN